MVNDTITETRLESDIDARSGAVEWIGSVPPVRDRAVVVAPHPDDEVLGCGGMLRWLSDAGIPFEIIAVTDGEASHAHSRRVDPAWLRVTRAHERVVALARLGLHGVRVHRLGFADAGVAPDEHLLGEELAEFCDDGTTIVVPWSADGHPDHEAVGRAGAWAAGKRDSGLWPVAIWANVRGEFTPAHVLHLGDFAERKRAAVAAFTSQIDALGADPEDGPVLSASDLRALVGSYEYIVRGS
jgi:LmbE family N-acetylglucosaminyl deacetylase